jgi:hypothetical protein
MRYRWTIKTGDAMYAGTDSSVFLSLAGLDASMREVEISDPDTINDWEKGDQNHGVIETDDLGELQTGTLRSDNSGPSSGWQVDWVKVQNEEDGREWTATVGKWDDNGRFPMLKFARTDDGQFEQIQSRELRLRRVERPKKQRKPRRAKRLRRSRTSWMRRPRSKRSWTRRTSSLSVSCARPGWRQSLRSGKQRLKSSKREVRLLLRLRLRWVVLERPERERMSCTESLTE